MPYFDGLKQLFQSILVYAGSTFTIVSTWLTNNDLNQTQDIITIAVGLATFIYTVLKIAEIRQRMRIEKERAEQ